MEERATAIDPKPLGCSSGFLGSLKFCHGWQNYGRQVEVDLDSRSQIVFEIGRCNRNRTCDLILTFGDSAATEKNANVQLMFYDIYVMEPATILSLFFGSFPSSENFYPASESSLE